MGMGMMDAVLDATGLRAQADAAAAAEEARVVAKFKAQGLNPDGSPIKPEFESLIDPVTGRLKDQYQIHGGADVTVDQRAIDEIRNRGLETGDSAWAKMALDKQRLGQTDQLDQARQQSAGAQAQTLSALMMRGGVSGGSRERIGSRSLKDQMMAAQQVGRQGQLDRAGIGVQDQSMKNDFLKQTADLDFRNADLGLKNRDYKSKVDEANLSNSLREVQGKREYDMGTYSEQMKKWAAGRSADAQAASANKGKK